MIPSTLSSPSSTICARNRPSPSRVSRKSNTVRPPHPPPNQSTQRFPKTHPNCRDSPLCYHRSQGRIRSRSKGSPRNAPKIPRFIRPTTYRPTLANINPTIVRANVQKDCVHYNPMSVTIKPQNQPRDTVQSHRRIRHAGSKGIPARKASLAYCCWITDPSSPSSSASSSLA